MAALCRRSVLAGFLSIMSTMMLAGCLGKEAKTSEVAEKPSTTQNESGKTDMSGTPVVIMETSEGSFEIELWPEKAPESVKNFLQYVDDGFYNGTIFHRVIDGFMIQGGGFTADMEQKPTREPVKNEASAELRNDIGTVAMARTMVVDSATAQFFVNLANNDFLNHRSKTPDGYGYAVFGKVINGMDVVNKIKNVPTGNQGMHQNVPTKPVVIKSAKRK